MLTLSEECKFHLIFAKGSESSREKTSWEESSRERKYQGAKVPYMELLLPGAKVRGNESSCYRRNVSASSIHWRSRPDVPNLQKKKWY